MIKNIFNSFFLFFIIFCHSQTKVFGYLKGSNDNKSIYKATVTLLETGKSIKTDKIGYFQFKDLAKGSYTLSIVCESYITTEKQFDVVGGKKLNMNDIIISYDPESIDNGIVTISDAELNSDESFSQNSLGLLQSSIDAYTKVVNYQWGNYWFRNRGYDASHQTVDFNGILMNRPDDNQINYSSWGGLNDITRYPEQVTPNTQPSDNAFGNINGIAHFDTQATNYKKGIRLSWSMGNQSYNNRLMTTYSTGIGKKGWAFTLSGSKRWAKEGRVSGSFYDAYAYFVSVQKKINATNSLNFTFLASPNRHALSSPNTKEVYDLKGINYNSYWGYQNGEKRNERVRNTHEPIAMLTHYWQLNKKTNITSTLAYQFGKNGISRLDWYAANNPSPTYYKKLPSWYMAENSQNTNYVYDAWQNDTNYNQINWSELYQENANMASNAYGKRATYFLVEDINKDKIIAFNSHITSNSFDKFTLNASVNYKNTISENYRQVNDLLGADYALNRDNFANSTESGNYNENEPNDLIYKGSKINYNLQIHHQCANLYLLGQWKFNNWGLDLGLKSAYTSMYRDGKYLNYRYLNNSYGKSDTKEFADYGMKLKINHKINGRNFINLNSTYFSNAPTTDNVFTNSRVNNFVLDAKSSIVFSNDINYNYTSPKISGKISAFFTQLKNDVTVARYYADGLNVSNSSTNALTTEILSGINKTHLGVEMGLEYNLNSTLVATAAACIGQYTYANNPNLTILNDSIRGAINYGTAYLKGYRVSGTPQHAYSLGLQYRSAKFWWVGAAGNYLTSNYIAISPIRRTINFITNPDTGIVYDGVNDNNLKTLLKQEEFSAEFMINCSAGKTIKLGDYSLGISLMVNNLLNNKNYITGGYEQGRLANYPDLSQDIARKIPVFGSKYWYNQGLSYFLNVFLRF